jgi:hypothetical protein
LENAYVSCPKNDIEFIGGDFNAEFGKKMTFRPTIGMHSMHENTNGNRPRIIFFAASQNLVIGTTLFPHKDPQKNMEFASW